MVLPLIIDTCSHANSAAQAYLEAYVNKVYGLFGSG